MFIVIVIVVSDSLIQPPSYRAVRNKVKQMKIIDIHFNEMVRINALLLNNLYDW